MQKASNRVCCNLTFPHSHHMHIAHIVPRCGLRRVGSGLFALGRMVLITAPGGGGHCSRVVCLLHSEVVLAVSMSPCLHTSCDPVNHVLIVSNTSPHLPSCMAGVPSAHNGGAVWGQSGDGGEPGPPSPTPSCSWGNTDTLSSYSEYTHNSPVL